MEQADHGEYTPHGVLGGFGKNPKLVLIGEGLGIQLGAVDAEIHGGEEEVLNL
jgi:hypothetical protein